VRRLKSKGFRIYGTVIDGMRRLAQALLFPSAVVYDMAKFCFRTEVNDWVTALDVYFSGDDVESFT
jgi:hypothetical protein